MNTCVGICQIRNRTDNSAYIGSSKNLNTRWADHRKRLRRGNHYNIHLQFAWNKYGEENFIFEPLFICDIENLIIYEQLCINKLNSRYNILTVANRFAPWTGKKLSKKHRKNIGNGVRGIKRTDETRRKMSLALIGNKNNLGVSPSVETRKKISDALSGRVRTLDEIYRTSKLKVEDVHDIRDRLLLGHHQADIAKDYNVTRQLIHAIETGRVWKNV